MPLGASDPSSNDQATPTVGPAMPIEANEVPRREQSHSVTQPHSPAMQGNGVPQQLLLDRNVFSNIGLQPVQPNADHLQPQFPSHNSFQPFTNNNNGQQQRSFSMQTLTQSLDPAMQWVPTFPTPNTGHQQRQLGHLDPGAFGSFASYNPALVQSADLDALANSQNCACGKDCNCPMCSVHPYNAATVGIVHELGQVMARDNYGEGDLHANPRVSQPLSGTGGALTNSTITESAMGQGLLPIHDGFSTWMNASTEDPAPRPTYEEGEAVNNGIQSNEYYNIAYPVRRCTGIAGICPCDRTCTCPECLNHQ